ncbi:flagellar FliJ family protein [Lapillicoccus jejuensis]|uniref:Flagellar FliJ protein n=1 Tax=Lapillicoccus jejuensis TaxID=402171 RepID=A0A542E489_9MICO|nr:flagellar FliJ family protein [Lapillicoccus jejuensis]TQJ10162.1 FliJ-like protein [Lapillicoccus jejuensis]
MSTRSDRGLAAVARVRSLRERDSLLGLLDADARRRAEQDVLDGLEGRLSGAGAPRGAQPTADFLAERRGLLALGEAAIASARRLEGAGAVAAAARGRWQLDRTRLEAISLLQERRVEREREERRHREDGETDEVAGRLWLRGATQARIQEQLS